MCGIGTGSRLAAATIVAKCHLSLGRVVATSFRLHHPNIPFFLLLADEVDSYFDPAAEPYAMLRLPDIGIPHLSRMRFHYTRQELGYAATPYLISHLLDGAFAGVIFIKEESLVLDSMIPVLAQLEHCSALLTPHLLEPLQGAESGAGDLSILLSGVYNGGFLAFADTSEARRFLAWWQDRLIAHCRYAVADGMHFEQRWLDFAPAFLDRLGLVRDPGMNVAHWNLPGRRVRLEGDKVWVDGFPGRLFRFSGFDPDKPGEVTRYFSRLRMSDIGEAAELFRRYNRLLEEAGYASTRLWPYAYDCFDNGIPIPYVARQAYRDLGRGAEEFGDPFRTDKGSFLDWLTSPADPAQRSITRLWRIIYDQRPDLQAAYPQMMGRDAARFLEWAMRFGTTEHQIAEALVPANPIRS